MADTTAGLCECGCGAKTSIAKLTDRRVGRVKGQPARFISGHNARKQTPEYLVEDCGYESPCWVWQRSLTLKGYGQITVDRRNGRAHRVYYERHVGPIPDGLQLDHLCRNRACVNPDHLEAVTCAANIRRGRATKLTYEQVGQIRSLLERSKMMPREIAERFGVSRGAIDSIKRGQNWRIS